MTKKKVNQQNSSVKFKIKVTKIKDVPKFESLVDKMKPLQIKYNIGLYQQLKNSDKKSITQLNKLSLKEIEEAITEIFYGKKEYINEHRKKFSFGDKISKQTP